LVGWFGRPSFLRPRVLLLRLPRQPFQLVICRPCIVRRFGQCSGGFGALGFGDLCLLVFLSKLSSDPCLLGGFCLQGGFDLFRSLGTFDGKAGLFFLSGFGFLCRHHTSIFGDELIALSLSVRIVDDERIRDWLGPDSFGQLIIAPNADRGQADIPDRSRCSFDGHKWPRQRNGWLQCAKCRRHQASSHCFP
jgi:hypothetical protein